MTSATREIDLRIMHQLRADVGRLETKVASVRLAGVVCLERAETQLGEAVWLLGELLSVNPRAVKLPETQMTLTVSYTRGDLARLEAAEVFLDSLSTDTHGLDVLSVHDGQKQVE